MNVAVIKRDEDEGDDSIIRCVFASSDLVFNILRPLIDGDPCTTIGLLKLATVSKSFQNTVQSNQFWCDICYQRWKTKWGLRIRWNKALSDYNSLIELGNEESLINFWKSRHFYEERDARRRLITADELVSLVFDFRFWLGHQIINEDGDLITKSGLFESASRDFRFSVVPSDLDEYDGEGVGASHSQIPLHTIPASSARGQIKGHPMYETGIEWFLKENEGKIQWGFVPSLWPEGTVERLDNWGWQIHNMNVVMRSIDNMSGDERTICTNHGDNNVMWKDLIDSLDEVDLSRDPRLVAILPRPWIAYLQNQFLVRFEV